MTTFTTEDLEELKTPWFPVTVNPVYAGLYEIMTAHWPWPSLCEWNGSNWSDTEYISQWRGLKANPELDK